MLECVARLERRAATVAGECIRSASVQHGIHVISGKLFVDEKTNRRTPGAETAG